MREKEFLPLLNQAFGIEELNPMQKESMAWGASSGTLMISSPTGSGKTLAFILPVLKLLKDPSGKIQCVIMTPTRELTLQVTEVIRSLAKGYKVTPLYGGHKFEDEENSLRDVPEIVVATPGRLVDHINRRTIDTRTARLLVLDEYDKILELGFEQDMKKVIKKLPNVSRIILTSATPVTTLPDWLGAENITRIDKNPESRDNGRLRVHKVETDTKDKIEALRTLLADIMPTGQEKTIVFVNHRESAERVADSIRKRGGSPGLYHGALDQSERENAIAMFNNGSTPLLIATDLAARGLDIAEVKNIIHYHQPLTEEAYLHRNGRTARIDREGDAYVIIGPEEDIKPWVEFDDEFYPSHSGDGHIPASDFVTLSFSAGKKEKLSKADILGFLVKQGNLTAGDIGKIDLKDHYSLAAVKRAAAKGLLERISNEKIKGQKRKIFIMNK